MSATPQALAEVAALVQRAHAAIEQRQPQQAQALYESVLTLDPDHVEALHFLGLQMLAQKHADTAITLLQRAAALAPTHAPLRKNLGVALLDAGRAVEAVDALRGAIALEPDFFLAHLHLGVAFEDLGNERESLQHYFGAVRRAQAKGRWLSEASTAPVLRELVLHAMDRIDGGLRALFDDTLAPLRAAHGDAALARVAHCMELYLHPAQIQYPDARQQPKFLYFPELPATTYFDRALFPWYAELERHVDVIREELRAVLADRAGVEPFLQFDSPDQIGGYLAGEGAAPNWDAFFFYRHGERHEANCARCPRTAAIIDSLPLVHVRDHAPEICFSVLTPGTHILPHRGVTNTRVVTHFPLIVPDECALVVGGETRAWREGECFTFDDTFEHEAWNRGGADRVVMLLDSWNPYLTAVEREAIALLVPAIGDFNRGAGIDTPTH